MGRLWWAKIAKSGPFPTFSDQAFELAVGFGRAVLNALTNYGVTRPPKLWTAQTAGAYLRHEVSEALASHATKVLVTERDILAAFRLQPLIQPVGQKLLRQVACFPGSISLESGRLWFQTDPPVLFIHIQQLGKYVVFGCHEAQPEIAD